MMAGTRKADQAEESAKEILKKWNEYYANNDFGIGVQCDSCGKWRKVLQYRDKREVPKIWMCSMWKIGKFKRGSCRMTSSFIEEDFSSTQYVPGDLVCAKMNGYPWWPAMIEDSPDNANFCMDYEDSEHEYHANFLGEKPLRNWIKVSKLKDFSHYEYLIPKKKMKGSLLVAIEQAKAAMKMTLKERLAKLSFCVRYDGKWGKVKKHEAILPPETKESMKPKGPGSKLVRFKPPINQDLQQASVGCLKKLKSRSATKRKCADDDVQPIESREKNKRKSGIYFREIGNSGKKEKQQSSDKKEQVIKFKKQRTLKRRHKKTQNEDSDKNSTLSESQHSSLNKGLDQSQVKESSNCGETSELMVVSDTDENSYINGDHLSKGGTEIQSMSNEESNISQAKEVSNCKETVDVIFLSDTEENNDSNEDHFSKEDTEKEHMFEDNHLLATDRNSPTHDILEIFSESEDDVYVSPNFKAYEKYMNKLYPPIKFDIHTESSDSDAADSNDCYIIISKVESYAGKVHNKTEITFPDNGSLTNDVNATTNSDSGPVSNENSVNFSNNHPVIKDEIETSFSDNDNENETSISDDGGMMVKCENEMICLENDGGVNNGISATYSQGELVVEDENETSSSVEYFNVGTMTENKYDFNDTNASDLENEPISNDENTSSDSETIIIDENDDSDNEPVINESNDIEASNYMVLNPETGSSFLVQGANFPVEYSKPSFMFCPNMPLVPKIEYSNGGEKAEKKYQVTNKNPNVTGSKHMPYSFC